MLARKHRITDGQDYRVTVRRGSRAGTDCLMVATLLTSPSAPSRFGFIAGKQVGNAVVRNRMRRRLKAIAAERLALAPTGFDAVVRLHPVSRELSWDDLRSTLLATYARSAERARREDRRHPAQVVAAGGHRRGSMLPAAGGSTRPGVDDAPVRRRLRDDS